MKRRSDSNSIGDLLEDTRWDYAPDDGSVGLLSPMSRFFRGFPWQGRGEGEKPGRREQGGDLDLDDLTLDEL